MMGYYYGYGFSMFWIMLVCMALVIAGIFILVKTFGSSNHGHSYRSGNNSAINILDERYAKGEISDEEYKSKKEMLRKS